MTTELNPNKIVRDALVQALCEGLNLQFSDELKLENKIKMLEVENRRLQQKLDNLIRCLGNVFMYKEDLPSVLEEGEEPPMKKGHFVIHTCHYNGMADIYKFETEEEQQAVMAYLDGSEGDITCPTQLTYNSYAKSMKYFREEGVKFEEEEEEEKTEE